MSETDEELRLIDPKILEGITKRTSVKRLSTSEYSVSPVVFLSSGASNFMTGQLVCVIGGASVWAA